MAEEIIGPGVEPKNVILLKYHAVKLPSKHLCLYHRLGILTVLVRGDSFAVGSSLWRDRSGQCAENK